MYTKDYIRATYEVLQKDSNTQQVLSALSSYLEKRGLSKLYPAILRGLIDKRKRKEKNLIPKVIVARTEDFKKFKSDIDSYTKDGDTPLVLRDETIIGGFIIKTKDTYIDQSYKSKLLHAYHRATN